MAQITDYSSLASSIATWEDRSDLPVDELIGLAEAEFRLRMGPHYARETSGTVAFTSGSASLPSGFIRPIVLTHSTYGEVKLSTLANVRSRRVWDASGIPAVYAVTGSTLECAPLFTGNLSFSYEATLAGLTSLNTTNWLITNAPQAYLDMCRYFAKSYVEDPSAAAFRAVALDAVDALVENSTLAKYSQAGVVLRGSTP